MTTREKLFPPFAIEKSQNHKNSRYQTFDHSSFFNFIAFLFWNVHQKGFKIEFFQNRFFSDKSPFGEAVIPKCERREVKWLKKLIQKLIHWLMPIWPKPFWIWCNKQPTTSNYEKEWFYFCPDIFSREVPSLITQIVFHWLIPDFWKIQKTSRSFEIQITSSVGQI